MSNDTNTKVEQVKVTRNSVDFVLIQKTSRARKGKDGCEGVPEKFWSVNLEEAALSDVDAWLGHYADKTSVLLDYAQSTLGRNVKAAQLKIDSSMSSATRVARP